VQSYKHKATRPLIPSKEEAGMEDGNETVSRKSVTELPLNPVVTCGQDPELFQSPPKTPKFAQKKI